MKGVCADYRGPFLVSKDAKQFKNKIYVIQAIINKHNLRTYIIVCCQIRTVFDQEYERVINLKGYDCISNYYYYNS